MNEQYSTHSSTAYLISQGRSLTLGFATLCILLFHQPFLQHHPYLAYPCAFGFWGVELFLFLSGFGIYYALKKSEGRQIRRFYIKRLLRILPAAILAGMCLELCNPFFHGTLLDAQAHYKLTAVACLFGLHLWYIRAILVFYVLSPFLFRILHRPLLLLGIAIAGGTIGLIAAQHFQYWRDHLIYTTFIWPALRFPAYLLGMKIAESCSSPQNKVDALMRHPYLLLLFALGGLSAAVYFFARPFQFFFLLPALVCLCQAFGRLATAKISSVVLSYIHHSVCNLLAWIGKRSLEFYLTHLGVYHAIRYLHPEPDARLLPLAWLIISILVVLIHEAASRISSFLLDRHKPA